MYYINAIFFSEKKLKHTGLYKLRRTKTCGMRFSGNMLYNTPTATENCTGMLKVRGSMVCAGQRDQNVLVVATFLGHLNCMMRLRVGGQEGKQQNQI